MDNPGRDAFALSEKADFLYRKLGGATLFAALILAFAVVTCTFTAKEQPVPTSVAWWSHF
ncbi:hypothetical protein V5P93_002056 [Actinokineospora auranticolor]|uniref:Uncharacterized protein n=1 Tax=Actinokineospora auranticolor TaxID=155976 RepID=A0A2S6GCM1_9PSEU|nr:hypothetical protein CLV40_13416 [Actinokineospora auranticolor]